MVDLVQWLTAQLDTDERIARAATPGPWEQVPERVGWLASEEYWSVVDCSGTPTARENAEHVAVWDPARVLREIDAKRQLLGLYAEVAANDVDDVEYANGWANALGVAVRLLAAPYSDRPGYREEWAP